MSLRILKSTLIPLAIWSLLCIQVQAEPMPPVQFNREVRSILADKCFACHGPDANKREAELRLDNEQSAKDSAIVPGKPDESELLRRILSDDPDERMPPGVTGKSLSEAEIATLRQWIAEGAAWQEHWSLIPPVKVAPPELADAANDTSAIDRFIRATLAKRGLSPSPAADRRTLIRRLSFDLTGLPPTPEEVDAFVGDAADDAYAQLVDRLMSSKHFGERMAVYWLDVVRYADTGGYHSDNHRDVAPYRDYVINAFNDNMPFDQFTVEQLAGDLLPNATNDQKIASGYNRLLQTTQEGGAQPKEYTAKYQADRVRNTATAWLGLTMGCCECHDHKFDQLTMKDFYSFGAFFADIQEVPVGNQPQVSFATPEEESLLAKVDSQLASLRGEYDATTPEFTAGLAKWLSTPALDEQAGLPDPIAKALKVDTEKRSDAERTLLDNHYRTIAPELASIREQIAANEKQQKDIRAAIPQTLISVSIAPRKVRILPRGNWLDDSGEVVDPATPTSLPKVEVSDRQTARLDLARWMAARENPLTARVFVNRLWKLTFGQGIVKSLDDFGTQGNAPTHPELLDWLAVEFMESGWDVKHMIQLMVTSETYQQSSFVTPQVREIDPSNKWLARQARFRLDAEMVRDNALAVSGLLSPTIGGPSVKPYQPAGYWQHLNFPKREWQQDKNENLYRRGLYTYWQRTFLHPSLLAFDAPSREECTVDRPRSNTPLQALALLNDPTYVEAARALAGRVIHAGGGSEQERLTFAFRQVLGRSPSAEEEAVLLPLYQKHLAEYATDEAAAVLLLRVGELPPAADVNNAELAAWTSVTRVILNLHETIVRY